MMAAMREFDWSYELGMYAGTATAVLAVGLVAGGLVVLIRYVLRGSGHDGSDKL